MSYTLEIPKGISLNYRSGSKYFKKKKRNWVKEPDTVSANLLIAQRPKGKLGRHNKSLKLSP
jgi:hypothetical protein